MSYNCLLIIFILRWKQAFIVTSKIIIIIIIQKMHDAPELKRHSSFVNPLNGLIHLKAHDMKFPISPVCTFPLLLS